MWTFVAFLLAFVHIAFAVVYLYLTWHHKYWDKRGLVTAKPLTLLGSYPGLFGGTSNFIKDLSRIYNKYKGKQRAVGVFLTRQPQILVLDASLAHEVLVDKFSDFRDTVTSSYVTHSQDYDKYVARNPFFSAGDVWKKRRTEGGAELTANKLKQAFAIWEQSGESLLDYMQRYIKEKDNVIETRDLCYRYTAHAMGDFIWGIDSGSLSGGVNEISQLQQTSSAWAFNAFQNMRKFNRTPIAPIIRRLLRMRFFTQEQDDFYLQLTRDAAQLRQAGNGAARNDYLAHLLQLQEQKGASIDDMVGHALTLLMDGYETSAAVLYHLLYTLGEYQEPQSKLRAEILNALAADKNITYEQLNALPYLDQCVNESMRMTSAIGFFIKICTRPTTIDLGEGKTVNVKPGITVAIPTYQIHHDERYYPDPMAFKPERFDNGAASEFNKRGCLLPFGDGPRICLGMRVGLLSVKMAVLRILSQYKVEQTTKLEYNSDTGMGMFLDGDVNLKYTKL
ncbi:probable cytochrome P450 309a1 [Drosophila albomicans]|uniref:Probable cytochrome P450 309a1 n=1 Tax=Drosophila albomicans TaxID=7291 RepID=A0A6P8XHN0_DROAB|nr:probable cytochrome P450 309a1 [Drosophila albomicans]